MARATAFPKSEQLGRKPKATKPRAPKLAAVPDDAPAPQDTSAQYARSIEIPLDRIVHGRNPRLEATAAELRDLTASIKQHGVLQPIRVRPIGDEFQIIAGHRRYEAAKAAGMKSIPVTIGIADDTTAFVQSLVENLQRQDLSPLDEARAFQLLLDEKPAPTQEAIGKQIGRSQSYIANALRLLGLEEPVKEALVTGKITVAHAKAMASLEPERQTKLVGTIVEQKLTSRDTEDRIRREKELASQAEEAKKRLAEQVAIVLPRAQKAAKKGLTVLVHSQDMVTALTEAGIPDVRTTDYRKDTESPQYKCDCKAAIIVSYGDGKITPVCIVPEHFKAWKSEQDSAKKEAAKLIEAKIEKARRTAANAMAAGNGAGLSMEGQRTALYVILTRDRGQSGYGSSDKATSFVRRHGGFDEATAKAGGHSEATSEQVWETITGLSDKDLGKEFGTIVAAMLFPNVFGQDGSWVAPKDAAIRQFYVDQFQIDPDVVWGKSKPAPAPAPTSDEYQPDLEPAVPDPQEAEVSDEGEIVLVN